MADKTSGEVPIRPKGSPALIILLVVVLAPALLLGQLLGAGGASVIGGFIALFSLLGAMGGPLRADLRRLAAIGPLIAFGAVAPRLLAETSTVAAFALIVILVFVAGLLPIRSHKYDSVALGLGMGTLFGYGMPISGAFDAWQLVLAAVAGLGAAVILRLVLGIRDPSGPTRTAVADLLDEAGDDFAAAFDTWSSDRPVRWLGTVLTASGQYRLARRTVSAQGDDADTTAVAAQLEGAGRRAEAIAAAVRAKSVTPLDQEPTPPPTNQDPLLQDAVRAMYSALDDAAAATAERDTSRVPLSPGFRRDRSLRALQTGLRIGSVQFRHALRTALGILLALLVSTFLRPGDPLLPTLLMTTFGVIQVSWRATLTRARDRLVGLVIGGVLVVLIILILPPVLFLPMALIGLAVGMWFITARPAIGTAGIIVISVGLNSELRRLEPGAVITEYVLLTLAALLIGGVIGFVIVPAWQPPELVARTKAAQSSTAGALRLLSTRGSRGISEQALRQLADAQAAIQQLVPDHEQLSPDQEQQLERLRSSLQDLLSTALFVSTNDELRTSIDPVQEAADIIVAQDGQALPPTDDGSLNGAVLVLAREVATQRQLLHASLA